MKKATLLVVEDEPNLLLGIRDILELYDYEVMTAANGRDALRVLEDAGSHLPDLIVSDIMMPMLNGLDLLKEVRKNENWVMIPFIFLTAKGSKADVQAGKRLGVDDYLVKPFDADDLLVAVESRLNRHRDIADHTTSAISTIKRSILTILNHEFRTPLTLVVAYADMLKSGNVEDMDESELVMFLREINSGADRLRRLVENFILLVELETGDAANTFNWRADTISDVALVVQSAVDRVFAEPSCKHTCEVVSVGPVPAIHADRDYLMTMISELLSNAIKFSESHEPVRVELEADAQRLHVRVIDHGRGIPPAKLENIWQTFYQIDRDQFEDQGAGSGLAIVNGLARLHAAQLDVTSEVGEGSCFTVSFPALRD